jgi:hypothetical protein
MLIRLKILFFTELYWNFLFFKMGKMEAKMEVSKLNFYYSA